MALGTNNWNTIEGTGSNAGILAELAAGAFVDNLQFIATIDKADANDYKGKNGYSANDTIYISRPATFVPTATFNATSTIQAVNETKVPLNLDIISSVAVDIDSAELAYQANLKSIFNRVIKPAAEGIAQDVEATALRRAMLATYNIVGTAGATAFDTATVLSSRQKLNEFLAPQKDRSILLNPGAEASAVNARKGFINDPAKVSKQYVMGSMGMADGFEYYSNNLLPRLISGTATGAHTVTTTSVAGATTLAVTGTGTQTITAGQTFTVAGVNAVHPQTKQDLGYLQQFVVTANATAVAGAYTLQISPQIFTATSGSLQTVTAFPTASAVVTLGAGVGNAASTAYSQNIAYHKSAFRFVSVPLVMPTAVEFAEQYTHEGVTVAIVRAFDVVLRRMVTRVDFLGGFVAARPEWACRITS